MPSILDSILGQQGTPAFSNDTWGTMLKGLHPEGMAGVVNRYNSALMPGLMGTELGAEAMFDPNIAGLRGATTKSIMDDLARGGSLPPDVMAMIQQGGFENAGSSFGPMGGMSGAGRNLVARDIGQTSLSLLQDRMNRASGYVRSSPLPGQLYSPIVDLTPGTGMSFNIGRQNAQNAYEQMNSNRNYENSMNLINRPLQLSNAFDSKLTAGMAASSGASGGAGYGAMGGLGGNGATPETAGVVGIAGGGSSM